LLFTEADRTVVAELDGENLQVEYVAEFSVCQNKRLIENMKHV